MKEAPIFIRAYDLYSWLLDRFNGDGSYPDVSSAVLRYARELLNAISLALSRFDTHRRLIEADERATLLRVHLRLACEKKILTDRQLLHASAELRDIGRQIGGWLKRQKAVG